jgi:hypothetical protein
MMLWLAYNGYSEGTDLTKARSDEGEDDSHGFFSSITVPICIFKSGRIRNPHRARSSPYTPKAKTPLRMVSKILINHATRWNYDTQVLRET